jgi:hypothetical protein
MHACGHHERGGSRGLRIAGMVLGGLTLAVLLAVGLGWLVQYLWNNVLAALFQLPAITYWQAVGLFLLGKLLFGGVGHGVHHGPKRHFERWHRCDEDVFREHGKFHEFWESEGKAAFKAYVEKMKPS